MTGSGILFLAWSGVMLIAQKVLARRWERAQSRLLQKLAELEAGKPLGAPWRPAHIWWTFVFYVRSVRRRRRSDGLPLNGLWDWFLEPHPDQEVEVLRQEAVAPAAVARRRTYFLLGVFFLGAMLIFMLAS